MSDIRDELPLSIAAYVADTQHLSTVQHGAYLLILMTMRRAGGWLPDDDRKLSNIVKMTLSKWKTIAPDIRSLLISEGGRLTQKRVLSDFKKAYDLSLKNAANGKSGGLAKSLKNKEPTLATARVSPSGSLAARQDDSDSALTDSKKVETTGEKKKVRAKSNRGDPLPSDWLPNDAHYAKGFALGFDRAKVDFFAERMRNWAGANAHRAVARKSNWDLAFHNWLSDKAERNGGPPNGKAETSIDPNKLGFAGQAALRRHRLAQGSERPAPEDLEPVNRR